MIGDSEDVKPGADCEVVHGIATTPAPPPSSPSPHPGAYAGTTSQGKSIGFDVSGDGKTIMNLKAVVDLNCQELPIPISDTPVELSDPISVQIDHTFAANFRYGSGSGILFGSVVGSFDAAGHAAGTLTAEFDFYPQGRLTHCPSGSLTWNAQ